MNRQKKESVNMKVDHLTSTSGRNRKEKMKNIAQNLKHLEDTIKHTNKHKMESQKVRKEKWPKEYLKKP